ncbi:MAG: hypothetical protein ACU88J_05810 [Gammaproteobacteria bacterium]
MYKGLLSRLKIAFRNGMGGGLWFKKLMSLISIFFVVFSPNHSKAIPLTKEQTVLEKRIESVRDNLLKQDQAKQGKANTNQILSWYNWGNWPNWNNWNNWRNWPNWGNWGNWANW